MANIVKTNPPFVRDQRLRPGWLSLKTAKFGGKGRNFPERRRKSAEIEARREVGTAVSDAIRIVEHGAVEGA
jgi:hypothetical protein